MAEQKIAGPQAPVEWDLPDSPAENSPDKSFNDDHVAARVKLDEAARQRLAVDRVSHEPPRDILTRHEKIEEAAPFLRAQEDDQARRARRELQQTGDAPEAGVRERTAPETLSKVEQRIELLLADLYALQHELEAQPQAPAARLQELQAQLLRLELQAKQNLQMLLAGGVGLTIFADPRLTFKRLFDRVRRWPRRVRPGRRPETAAEFDAFLAWAFEPPAAPEPSPELRVLLG